VELFVTTTTTTNQLPQDDSTTADGVDGVDGDEFLLWADQATDAAGYALGASVSIRDLPVAMKRAASGMAEMTSRDWWQTSMDDRPTATAKEEGIE